MLRLQIKLCLTQLIIESVGCNAFNRDSRSEKAQSPSSDDDLKASVKTFFLQISGSPDFYVNYLSLLCSLGEQFVVGY